MTTLISCCNEALSQIAAGTIASLTEGSIEARECNRFATTLVSEIADWYEWPFLTKRVVLAQVPNDRTAEWTYAYAAPSDLANPLMVRSVQAAPSRLPEYGPGNFPRQDAAPIRFLTEGGKVYTNTPQATLVYTSSTLDLAIMPPLLRRAFILELSARIALPIKKDAALAQALAQRAQMAKNEAIADEANKNPHQQTEYISNAEWARMGAEW